MTTALTGSAGWTGLHPMQLGGPPLISTWSRPLATTARPLIAHAYLNDGVTPSSPATFPILNRPAIKATLANGGYEQVTLEIAAPIAASLYGSAVYGVSVYGIGVQVGNVIRLTEQGGPWPGFVYSGIIESFPDARSPTGTKHQIVLTPFGAELTRVATQLVYTATSNSGVDIAQVVRDAVSLTQHCSCDQVSVPITTGIPLVSTSGGQVDFRNQKVNQVLDTVRSIAGPNWFWHCDEMGRVWFQQQGSVAVTLMGGQHYEERVSNGGDIQDRINQVPAVGGVPTGGSANVQVTVNGASQAAIGVRTLDPPIQVPGVTDQATLAAIAAGILGTLDQTWQRVQLKALPTLGQRVHASQPGGAMVRYWEPASNPLPESAAGAGYVGPFIGQSVTYDGLTQQIEAGNIPVTSSTDVANMVQQWAQRASAIAFINTAASLNLSQTLTGNLQSSPGVTTGGVRGTLWSLTQQEFAAIDPSGVARAEMGNLGTVGSSPAQWGFRTTDAGGNPIMDSFGLFGTAKPLNFAAGTPGQNITGTGSGNYTVITGSAYTIVIPNFAGRPQNIQVWLYATAKTSGGSGTLANVRANVVGFNTSAGLTYDKGVTGLVSGALWFFPVGGIPPGTYTVQMEGAADTGQTLFVSGFFHQTWLSGSTG